MASRLVRTLGWLVVPILISASAWASGSPGQTPSAPLFVAWRTEVGGLHPLLGTWPDVGGIAVDPRSRRVWTAAADGVVTCLDGPRVIWQVTLPESIAAPPEVSDAGVFVATASGSVFLLNKITGAILGRSLVRGVEFVTRPLVVEAEGGPWVVVGTSDESIVVVQPQTGEKRWRLQREAGTKPTLRGFARPVVRDGVVYAGFGNGSVAALRWDDGTVVWERVLPGKGDEHDVDGLAWVGGALVAASASSGAVGLDPASGSVRWRVPIPGASVAETDGRVVVVGSPGRLDALDPASGRGVWSAQWSSGAAVHPPQVAGEYWLVAQWGGDLMAIHRRSGRVAGTWDLGSPFSAPPAVTGRMAFALTNAGGVYAFGVVP